MTSSTVDTAMVFAAGLGTRMRPLTDTMPKPLITVGGRTMLDQMLDRLGEAGVTRAVVNVHYRPDQIEARLAGRTEPAIVVSDERELLLDQGGGIVRALPHLGRDAFFICNTDAVWIARNGWDLGRLQADWDPERMDVLLLVAAVATSIGVDWPGDFFLGADRRLTKRPETTTAPFVYAGVGIIRTALFDGLPETPFRLAPFFFRAAEQGRLFGTVLDGTWLHVGTPAAVDAADAAFARAHDDGTTEG